MSEPIIRTDERGLWIRTANGAEYAIEWAEIFRVSGGKGASIDFLATTIALDSDDGEGCEPDPDWPQLQAALEAIYSRLAAIDPPALVGGHALGGDD